MANIFPGGVSFLQKSPNALEVIEAQGRASERGTARGTQIMTNFMQGRRFARQEQEAVEEAQIRREQHVATMDVNSLQRQAEQMRIAGETFKLKTLQDEARRTLALDSSKTDLSQMLTELTETGDWTSPDLLPRLYGMAAKHPDVAETDLFKEAIKNHRSALEWKSQLERVNATIEAKPDPIRAEIDKRDAFLKRMREAEASGDKAAASAFAAAAGVVKDPVEAEILKTDAMMARARQAAEEGDELGASAFRAAAGAPKEDKVEMPEADQVALRKWNTETEPKFKSALAAFDKVKMKDINRKTVGPFRPLVLGADRVFDFFNISLPGSRERSATRTDLTLVFSAVRDAFFEANPSDKEGERIDRMLQSEEFWSSPQAVWEAFKSLKENFNARYSAHRKGILRILPPDHPDFIRLSMEDPDFQSLMDQPPK